MGTQRPCEKAVLLNSTQRQAAGTDQGCSLKIPEYVPKGPFEPVHR